MSGAKPSVPDVHTDQSNRALILVTNSVTHDSRVLREAATLRRLGFAVLVAGLVSADERQTELSVDGFPVIRLTPLESARRILRRRETAEPDAKPGEGFAAATRPAPRGRRPLATLRRLVVTSIYYLQGAALVRRTSPTIVHANDYDTMWIGILAKLLRGSRLVYDSHELWPDRGRPEWRPWLVACEWLFVRLADATITVSPGCAEVMAERYRVSPPVVVRNVPARIAQQPTRAEGLRAGEPPLAVYVGGLAPDRGIEVTIQALALVPDVRLRLIGYGSDEYRAQLEARAAAAGVANRIEYPPPVEPAAVAATIAGADMGIALIEPSCLSYRMSLPNKLFEYVTAGLPILGSDLPVIGPLVREERLGEAVRPDDIAAIAGAMRRLADPDRNAEVRTRVRSYGERVNWEHERLVLEEVYNSLIVSTSSSTAAVRESASRKP
jgi:glycosyltransferase involved in cell wall biosynthesis